MERFCDHFFSKFWQRRKLIHLLTFFTRTWTFGSLKFIIWKVNDNLTDKSEGERSVPQISSKIARSVRALGYVELDYVCRFLFSLEALKQVYPLPPTLVTLLYSLLRFLVCKKSFRYKFVLKLLNFVSLSTFKLLLSFGLIFGKMRFSLTNFVAFIIVISYYLY